MYKLVRFGSNDLLIHRDNLGKLIACLACCIRVDYLYKNGEYYYYKSVNSEITVQDFEGKEVFVDAEALKKFLNGDNVNNPKPEVYKLEEKIFTNHQIPTSNVDDDILF